MNSKVIMVLRLILGLILLVFGVNKLPMPPMEEALAAFMGALGKTGYMYAYCFNRNSCRCVVVIK